VDFEAIEEDALVQYTNEDGEEIIHQIGVGPLSPFLFQLGVLKRYHHHYRIEQGDPIGD
jgi:hypothetical protein